MKRYELTCFNDFLAIPPDKIEKCLKDFSEAVILANATQNLGSALGEPDGVKFEKLTWVDDDKDELKVTIQVMKRP